MIYYPKIHVKYIFSFSPVAKGLNIKVELIIFIVLRTFCVRLNSKNNRFDTFSKQLIRKVQNQEIKHRIGGLNTNDNVMNQLTLTNIDEFIVEITNSYITW